MCFKVFRCDGLPDLPEHRGRLCATRVAGAGHVVAGGGDDGAKQRFVVRPSRGNRRRLAGGSTLTEAGLTDENPASDFWTIRIVQCFNHATRHNL